MDEQIPLSDEDVETLRSRTNAILYCKQEAERYTALARLTQEGLTLYMHHVYGIDLSRQWHIDFEEQCLIPLVPEDAGEPCE